MSEGDLPIQPNQLPPARCCNCGYVIEHLSESGACPECGTKYNFADPLSFTRKPPFIWWKFWLPAMLTALAAGVVLYTVLIFLVGYTWATVVCVPLSMGVIIGYDSKSGGIVKGVLLAIIITVATIYLCTVGLAGLFCGAVILALAVVPAFVGLGLGMILGNVLRQSLKRSSFSQRWHLLIPICFPLLVAAIEGRHVHLPPVSLTTSLTIHTPIRQAWESIQFYEQVKHPPPWLLRITPEFRPMYTTGHSEKVGDVKVCVYEQGRLVKQITEVVPGKRLAFKVIEQTDIETRGVVLMDGSFDLTPSADGKSTTVTLTTRYEPLLAPRFAFLWSEKLAVHELHGHVLKGMKLDAEGRQ